MNDPSIFTKQKCGVCGKHIATRWCDYVVGFHSVVFYRNYSDFKNQSRYETCDVAMCDECAISLGSGWDICPYHKSLMEHDKLHFPRKLLKSRLETKQKIIMEAYEDGKD